MKKGLQNNIDVDIANELSYRDEVSCFNTTFINLASFVDIFKGKNVSANLDDEKKLVTDTLDNHLEVKRNELLVLGGKFMQHLGNIEHTDAQATSIWLKLRKSKNVCTDNTPTHTHAHPHTPTHTHAHPHTPTHTHTHPRTPTHTHAHPHIHQHKRARART